VVDTYDLSGAFLGTKLEGLEVYMHLPPEAGKYAKNFLRLEKSRYGLKSASKTFMKQLGEEVLKSVERVEYNLVITMCVCRTQSSRKFMRISACTGTNIGQ